MTENYVGLELVSIEALAAMAQVDNELKGRVDAAKEFCKSTFKKFKAREEEIARNGDRYEPSKILDLQDNLRRSIRNTLDDYVRGKGFLQEILSARVELEKDEVLNDIQALTKIMLKIELRKIIFEAGTETQALFFAKIVDGHPLTVEAIESSPIEITLGGNLTPEVLEEGKKRRREILKPVLAKKLHAMEEAQIAIESFANSTMSPAANAVDEITELAQGE